MQRIIQLVSFISYCHQGEFLCSASRQMSAGWTGDNRGAEDNRWNGRVYRHLKELKDTYHLHQSRFASHVWLALKHHHLYEHVVRTVLTVHTVHTRVLFKHHYTPVISHIFYICVCVHVHSLCIWVCTLTHCLYQRVCTSDGQNRYFRCSESLESIQ